MLRITESTDSLRDLVATIVETNLSVRDYRQNQVMKKVTSWAAIIAVPTFIASIYGMNFDGMPELGWGLGYPGVLALMLIAVFAIHRYFKRIEWL